MARAAGDIFAGIVERAGRLAAFQRTLNDLPTPFARKERIIEAHCHGLLSEEDTTLLIQAYQLETA